MNIKHLFLSLFVIFALGLFSGCYERPTGGSEKTEPITNSATEDAASAEQANTSTDNEAIPAVNEVDSTKAKASFHTRINLYIENSGSMNGYVTGNTTFKNALGDLLVNLKYEYGAHNIQLFFINDTIHPIAFNRDVTQFASTLSPATMRVGNVASSDLNLVFNNVLQKTDPGTISILLSDLIYSIQGANTAELLNYQKSQTKDAFLSKAKSGDDLQTAIVQLFSNFSGVYWDKNNVKTVLDNAQRPYYLSITGAAERMVDFNNKIDLLKIQGYANRFTLTTDDFSEDNYYSVLTSTYNAGRFKPIRSLSSRDYVRGIEDVTINDRSTAPFTFALAIDLSKIPIEESYKVNLKNYEVLAGNYAIDTVFAIEKKDIQPSDWVRIQSAKATHILLIKAENKAYSDFSFALKKQIPMWVYDTDTEDDVKIYDNLTKTFGFKYLIEGISEAYETVSASKDYYFDIKIPIRKASASNTGKIFVVVLILAAVSGLLYTYFKRRK